MLYGLLQARNKTRMGSTVRGNGRNQTEFSLFHIIHLILTRTQNLEASLHCRKKMKKKAFTSVEPAPDDVMMRIRTVPLLS